MKISVEAFSHSAGIQADECSALKRYLADEKIMQMAERIVQECFVPAEYGNAPEFPENDDLCRAWLAACFLGYEAAEGHYAALGFPHSVLEETLSDVGIWVYNTLRNNGVVGIDRSARMWQVALFHGRVTRHGRLECNTESFFNGDDLFDEKGRVLVRKGEPVINIHVPEDGKLDIDACRNSFERMRGFFDTFRKGYDWKGFVCESWLLDRQLRRLLDEKSNILKFQDLGYFYDIGESDSIIFRIFGKTSPESVKNPTSLQRRALEFMREGGRFRKGGLFIPR